MFSVGTDTEYFLRDTEGQLVSAIRFIQGGKRNPVALASGGNVTYDNVAMEFATPVAKNEEELVQFVKSTLSDALTHLPKGVSLSRKSSTDFPEKELNHPDARQFGCDPDYDAWELIMNEVDPETPNKPFRSVGGHLHVGYLEGSGNDFLLDDMGKVQVTKAFDLLLALPLTIINHSEDAVARRKLYGKAGCHRPTSYGVEYRCLSNFWTFSPRLVRLVHSLAFEALTLVRDGKVDAIIESIGVKEIQRVINEGDSFAANKIWTETLMGLLSDEVIGKFEAVHNMEEIDIYKEWEL